MALLFRKNIFVGKYPPMGAAPVRISIPKNILSIPYELKEGDKLIGEIKGVYRKYWDESYTLIPEIKPFKVEFVLKDLNSEVDSLYLLKEFWPVLRDYGVLPDEYSVKVEIEKAETKVGEKINIYPKRDVSV